MDDPADSDTQVSLSTNGRGQARTALGGVLVVAAVAFVVWVTAGVIIDDDVSQELPRQSSAVSTTAPVADQDPTPLPTVVEVPAGVTVPVIEPPDESASAGTAPSSDGTLTASGASVFATAPADRIAYAGTTVEGRDLVVTGVDDEGFRAERGSDGDGVYVAFAEAGPVRVTAGDHVAFNGLVRVVPQDDDAAEAGDLQNEPIYVHALWIEVQAAEEGS